RISEQKLRFRWKCTTTPRHLTEDLIREMGKAGCRRISIGLETLDAAGQVPLPRLKHVGEVSLENLAAWCRAASIQLNCFVVLGLPGSTPAGDCRTVAKVQALGARVRPTM